MLKQRNKTTYQEKQRHVIELYFQYTGIKHKRLFDIPDDKYKQCILYRYYGE